LPRDDKLILLNRILSDGRESELGHPQYRASIMTKILTSRCSDAQIKNLRSIDVSEGNESNDIQVGYTTRGLSNIFNRWPLQQILVDTV